MNNNVKRLTTEPETSNVEEQMYALQATLCILGHEIETLEHNLAEVICPTSSAGKPVEIEPPIMCRTAEKIFSAQSRVNDFIRVIHQINENLNIRGESSE